jgi:hypothetical protein
MDRLRFVENLAVSGRVRIDLGSGRSVARVRFSGAGHGRLTLRWNELARDEEARVTGTVGGCTVSLRVPAP